MNRPKNIVVVCEGGSEWTYLQRLNSFLASLPFPDGWLEVPVRFIGRPPRNGVGTGAYKAVERELRKAARQNPSAERWAWVDADIYARNEKTCGDSYLRRPADVAPFAFSVFNFEDFLACHLDDAGFERWRSVMDAAGHFRSPLCWEDYRPLFQKVLPGYRKADLPSGFVLRESLANLRRHVAEFPSVSLGALSGERMFAERLLAEIGAWYDV